MPISALAGLILCWKDAAAVLQDLIYCLVLTLPINSHKQRKLVFLPNLCPAWQLSKTMLFCPVLLQLSWPYQSRESWRYTAGSQPTLWQHKVLLGAGAGMPGRDGDSLTELAVAACEGRFNYPLKWPALVLFSSSLTKRLTFWPPSCLVLICSGLLFFLNFFFLLRVPGSDENDQCLLSMHGHRTGSLASQQSVLYKCKGVEELVFPSGFEQLLPHKKLLRVAAILEKLRQMTFLFFSHLYRKIHITTQQRTCVCLVRVSMQIQRPLANSLFGQQFCPRPFPWASELFLKTK